MKYLIGLLCVTIFFFASCQKEFTESETIPVIPAQDDSTLLSMYIELDTTEIAPLDTVLKKQYYYDNARRNIGIDFILGGTGPDYITKSYFFYNADDTLPFKRIFITPLVPDTSEFYVNNITFYFYENSILISDSTIHGSPHNKRILANHYLYSTGRIINVYTSYDLNSTSAFTQRDTIYLQRINGNISNQINNLATGAKLTFEYVYDDHPNPFYKTAESYIYPFYFLETFTEEVYEKNNAVEINQLVNNFNFKCLYEYKANGYPKVVRFYDSNGLISDSKGVYFYRK